MNTYTESQIKQLLPTWTYTNNGVEKDYVFKNFNQAFTRITSIALLCEKANHHPEWSNVYNKLHIRLTTHTSNTVTKLDIDLANAIDSL